MHIIINGNYLSLDNIFAITKINDLSHQRQDKVFTLIYHSGREVEFYQRSDCPIDGEFAYKNFYFKSEQTLIDIHNHILETLTTNATKFN